MKWQARWLLGSPYNSGTSSWCFRAICLMANKCRSQPSPAAQFLAICECFFEQSSSNFRNSARIFKQWLNSLNCGNTFWSVVFQKCLGSHLSFHCGCANVLRPPMFESGRWTRLISGWSEIVHLMESHLKPQLIHGIRAEFVLLEISSVHLVVFYIGNVQITCEIIQF